MNFDFSKEPGKKLEKQEYETKMEPVISIITPFYNSGKYIRQTVNSILNQTFPNFELLIIDDGSKDEESLKELEKIGVEYIVVTDISKDGTLQGPNFKMYEQIASVSKINFVVSGGIKDKQNILDVAKKDYYACIVGKAYYEGKVDLKEVIACLQNG